jgi:hypothetical protein
MSEKVIKRDRNSKTGRVQKDKKIEICTNRRMLVEANSLE